MSINTNFRLTSKNTQKRNIFPFSLNMCIFEKWLIFLHIEWNHRLTNNMLTWKWLFRSTNEFYKHVDVIWYKHSSRAVLLSWCFKQDCQHTEQL